MAKAERKPERKERKPRPQPHKKLLDTLAREIDPQASAVNPLLDQNLEVAPAVKKAYTFHISAQDAAQIIGCSGGESAETDLVTHWLLNGALNVMAHGAKEPEFPSCCLCRRRCS